MHDIQALQTYIESKLCDSVRLSHDELFKVDVTLAEVVTRSGWMTNSVDLMEAFARAANALRKDHGIRVRLPALTLDTPMSKVVLLLVEQIERQPERAA